MKESNTANRAGITGQHKRGSPMKKYIVRFVPLQDPRNALMQCEEMPITAPDDETATLHAKGSLPRSMPPDEIISWELRDASGTTITGGAGRPK